MSADRLRQAAEVLREREHAADLDGLVADWLAAEADHFERMASQSAALNFLIATSEPDGEMQTWRIRIGYQTTDKALAIADAVLGASEGTEAGDQS